MQITKFSKQLIDDTFDEYSVPRDYIEPIYNYLVHGYSPGAFFTAVLRNDWHGAITRSHPSNQIESLKRISNWIYNYMPGQAYGSDYAVNNWLSASDESRRIILEQNGLMYSSEEETIMALRE